MAADECRLVDWMREASELEGVSLCPEAAVCLGVLESALSEGHIGADETIVIYNTGAAQKYVEVIETDLPTIDHTRPIDWDAIGAVGSAVRTI